MDLTKLKTILDVVSSLVVLLGIPTGIYQYWKAKKKEQRDREYGTYNALDEKYLDFQNICFEHPELDVFDIPYNTSPVLNDQQKKQELIAFTILFAIFERAYLMYHDQSTEVKEKQWVGWDEYINGYCKRENFRNAWRISGNTFDKDYQDEMEKKLNLIS